jgi:hypothetical protein
MILKPQDIVILLKLVAAEARNWNYASLANELFMSVSEVHAGMKRAVSARLFDAQKNSPRRDALEEFLVHGVKYAFPPERGEITRGMPTGYAAPCLSDKLFQAEEYPPVWPYPEGQAKGYSFLPLYKSVPKAAAKDEKLYELLALLDAIRDGRARERDLAAKAIHSHLTRSKW